MGWRRGFGSGRDLSLQPLPLGFQFLQFGLQGSGWQALGNCIDDLLDAALTAGKFPLMLCQAPRFVTPQSVEFSNELIRKFLEELRVHEVFLEAVEDRRLQYVASNV